MSLQTQISCVRREIAIRKNVYPKWVATGKMRQGEADFEIAAMTEVLETLMKLNEERGLNERVVAQKG
jgi:hypothetical protein